VALSVTVALVDLHALSASSVVRGATVSGTSVPATSTASMLMAAAVALASLRPVHDTDTVCVVSDRPETLAALALKTAEGEYRFTSMGAAPSTLSVAMP